MIKPFPGIDVPVVDLKTGLMTQTWVEFLQSTHRQLLSGLSGQPDVQITALANTQVLLWSSALQKWVNGAN